MKTRLLHMDCSAQNSSRCIAFWYIEISYAKEFDSLFCSLFVEHRKKFSWVPLRVYRLFKGGSWTRATVHCQGLSGEECRTNHGRSLPAPRESIRRDGTLIFFILGELRHVCLHPVFSLQNGDFAVVFWTGWLRGRRFAVGRCRRRTDSVSDARRRISSDETVRVLATYAFAAERTEFDAFPDCFRKRPRRLQPPGWRCLGVYRRQRALRLLL